MQGTRGERYVAGTIPIRLTRSTANHYQCLLHSDRLQAMGIRLGFVPSAKQGLLRKMCSKVDERRIRTTPLTCAAEVPHKSSNPFPHVLNIKVLKVLKRDEGLGLQELVKNPFDDLR